MIYDDLHFINKYATATIDKLRYINTLTGNYRTNNLVV